MTTRAGLVLAIGVLAAGGAGMAGPAVLMAATARLIPLEKRGLATGIVVIGATGRNFAAGMSGGAAYVLDETGDFKNRCNLSMVDIEPLSEEEDITGIQTLLRDHLHYTGSTVADRILTHWQAMEAKFVKVIPKDYKRAMKALKRAELEGIPWEQAVMVGAHG